MSQRVLILGYGNPGRLDDGLGPALAAALERENLPGVTVDSDYQLTVEDAEPVARHDVVIFADAAVTGPEPFFFRRITPAGELGFSSHSVEPAGVLALAGELFGATPRGFALGIRGYQFNEFGEQLSPAAQANLSAALEFVRGALAAGRFDELAEPPAAAGAARLAECAGSAPAPAGGRQVPQPPGLSQAGES